jgi:hypothetical protein
MILAQVDFALEFAGGDYVCLENIYGDGTKINFVNATLDFTTSVPETHLLHLTTVVAGMTHPRPLWSMSWRLNIPLLRWRTAFRSGGLLIWAANPRDAHTSSTGQLSGRRTLSPDKHTQPPWTCPVPITSGPLEPTRWGLSSDLVSPSLLSGVLCRCQSGHCFLRLVPRQFEVPKPQILRGNP